MTPERLAEIKARANAKVDGWPLYITAPTTAHLDCCALLAEVQRLTDEIDGAGGSSDRSWSREIELVQENARLTALVAQIRADATALPTVSMRHVVKLIDASAAQPSRWTSVVEPDVASNTT